MMQEVRSRYLPTEPDDDPERRRLIVEATNAVENIFFLLARADARIPYRRRPDLVGLFK